MLSHAMGTYKLKPQQFKTMEVSFLLPLHVHCGSVGQTLLSLDTQGAKLLTYHWPKQVARPSVTSKGTGKSNPTECLEGKKFRDIGQLLKDHHALQEPTPDFIHGDSCWKVTAGVCGSLPGAGSPGDWVQSRSLWSHVSLTAMHKLFQKPRTNSAISRLTIPVSPEDTQEGSFLLSEIMTNIQGPQFSEVLSFLTHLFIYSFTWQILYLLRPAVCQALFYLQRYSNNQDRHGPCLLRFDNWAEKAVDYSGGEWALGSDHALGFHHLLATLGKFLNLSVPQTYHL